MRALPTRARSQRSGDPKLALFCRGTNEEKRATEHISEPGATPHGGPNHTSAALQAWHTLGLSEACCRGRIFLPPTCVLAGESERAQDESARRARASRSQTARARRWVLQRWEPCGRCRASVVPPHSSHPITGVLEDEARASIEIMWARARKCWDGAR